MTNTEINEAVARKLGWTENENHGWSRYPGAIEEALICRRSELLPNYCGSIQAAFEVVEHIKDHFGLFRYNGAWIYNISGVDGLLVIAEQANTPSMAICVAFLKLQGGL